MNTRPTEFRRVSDIRAQRDLERRLATRRAAEDGRAARYQASREYAMRCAERDALLRRMGNVPPAAPSYRMWVRRIALSLILTAVAWGLATRLIPWLRGVLS